MFIISKSVIFLIWFFFMSVSFKANNGVLGMLIFEDRTVICSFLNFVYCWWIVVSLTVIPHRLIFIENQIQQNKTKVNWYFLSFLIHLYLYIAFVSCRLNSDYQYLLFLLNHASNLFILILITKQERRTCTWLNQTYFKIRVLNIHLNFHSNLKIFLFK